MYPEKAARGSILARASLENESSWRAFNRQWSRNTPAPLGRNAVCLVGNLSRLGAPPQMRESVQYDGPCMVIGMPSSDCKERIHSAMVNTKAFDLI